METISCVKSAWLQKNLSIALIVPLVVQEGESAWNTLAASAEQKLWMTFVWQSGVPLAAIILFARTTNALVVTKDKLTMVARGKSAEAAAVTSYAGFTEDQSSASFVIVRLKRMMVAFIVTSIVRKEFNAVYIALYAEIATQNLLTKTFHAAKDFVANVVPRNHNQTCVLVTGIGLTSWKNVCSIEFYY